MRCPSVGIKEKCEMKRSGHFPSGHIPRTVPLDNFPSFLHGVRHSLSPFHHHHPPIYNIKRSAVNVYKIDRCRSVRVIVQNISHLVGRLGSGVRVSASFQIFALTAGSSVLDGEGNCLRGTVLENMSRGGMFRGAMSYSRSEHVGATALSGAAVLSHDVSVHCSVTNLP